MPSITQACRMMLQLHGSVCATHGHGMLQATVLAVTGLFRALHLSLPPIAAVASPIASLLVTALPSLKRCQQREYRAIAFAALASIAYVQKDTAAEKTASNPDASAKQHHSKDHNRGLHDVAAAIQK